MDLPILYAKKALVLGKIVSNYETEKQAMKEKNTLLFKTVLQERALLIDELKQLNEEEPELSPLTPLERLQKDHIEKLVFKIDQVRRSGEGFFPQ